MRRTHHAAAAAAFVLTVAPVTAACSSYEEKEIDGYVYCVDRETGQIVDDDHCDDGGRSGQANYWFWTTTDHHSRGYHVPSKYHKSFVDPRNANARKAAGIPSAGKVSSGQKIKSGGFGNGVKGGGG